MRLNSHEMPGVFRTLLYYYNNGASVFKYVSEIQFFLDAFRLYGDKDSDDYNLILEFRDFLDNRYKRKPQAMSIFTYIELNQKNSSDGVDRFYKLLYEFFNLKGIDYSENKKRKIH